MRSCNICVFEMYHKGVSCMCNILKKLGEAELEIMQVIWNSKGPVTSNYILKELQGRRKWQLSTLMTSLARLADKGFVSCDRSSGSNLYTSVISENEYKTGASRRFLEKLYNNSVPTWKNSGIFWMNWKQNIPGRMTDDDTSVSFRS